jgi:hypothetical protein
MGQFPTEVQWKILATVSSHVKLANVGTQTNEAISEAQKAGHGKYVDLGKVNIIVWPEEQQILSFWSPLDSNNTNSFALD